jgi:hypothetical protein
VKCFANVSRRIQRVIMGTMIKKLSKLKLGVVNNWGFFNVESNWFSVATLALGSRPRQRGCKGAGQEEAGSHITYSQECKKV